MTVVKCSMFTSFIHEIVPRSLLLLQASWAQTPGCSDMCSTNRHEVQLFGCMACICHKNVHQSAEMVVVCLFILEMSAKKPANFDM